MKTALEVDTNNSVELEQLYDSKIDEAESLRSNIGEMINRYLSVVQQISSIEGSLFFSPAFTAVPAS